MVIGQRDGKCVGVIDFQIGITRFLAATLIAATARIFLAMDPTGNDISCASDSRGDPNRFRWTVQGTGAAFHAAIFIHQLGLFFIHDEHPMRAYDGASAASNTAILIIDQRGDARQVSEILHCSCLETVLLTIP